MEYTNCYHTIRNTKIFDKMYEMVCNYRYPTLHNLGISGGIKFAYDTIRMTELIGTNV